MIQRLVSVLMLGTGLFFGACTSNQKESFEELKPDIVLSEDNSRVIVKGISGLEIVDEVPNGLLSVYVIEEGRIWQKTDAPISGDYIFNNNEISFSPKYSFLEETQYYARLDLSSLINSEESELIKGYTFFITKDKTPITFVENVYPTTNQIPRNLLKFYVQLSGSMTEGEVLEHIRILDAEGEVVQHAFLEIPQELWDINRQRLTILFDPGRIKRGMELLDEVGTPFEVGKKYTLEIGQEWKDGQQRELTMGYSKQFTIVEDDRTKLNEEKWEVITPNTGTKEHLELRFNESLDYALLNRLITAWNDQGDQIQGKIELTENESVWMFHPDEVWEEGAYSIRIETILEDLAGNNLISVFDVDLNNAEEVINKIEAPEFIELVLSID